MPITNESMPVPIRIAPNPRGPISDALMPLPGSSSSKNLYTAKPNVISEVPVRIHAIMVRS